MSSTIQFDPSFFADPTTLYANMLVSMLFARPSINYNDWTTTFLQQMALQGHTVLPGAPSSLTQNLDENSQENHETRPPSPVIKYCRKCKAHGIYYRIRKGGFHQCEFSKCSCEKCKYINQRRKDQLNSLKNRRDEKGKMQQEHKSDEEKKSE